MVVISDKISTSLGEYLVLPRFSSKDVLINGVSLKVPLTKYKVGSEKPRVFLNIPFVSSAMQSVTGHRLAVALAKFGGLGVIPCSQSIERQSLEVKKVKSERSGFVRPECISMDSYLGDVASKIARHGYSSFPVTESGKIDSKLLGLITKSDFIAEQHSSFKVSDRMISVDNLVFSYDDEVLNLSDASDIISKNRISVLPVVDRDLNLKFVVFRKDLDHAIRPSELLDENNGYVVGAAINTKDFTLRVPALVDAGVNILFVDSSNGLREFQKDAIGFVKSHYPSVPVVAGNFVSEEGFLHAVKWGADAVKVGMGPGSICTTQDQKGAGRGQATAIFDVASARDKYFEETGIYVPVIADGGVSLSRHMIVALGLGADCIMMGKWFARFDESAAPKVQLKGEWRKVYWGEGSNFSKKWRDERYGQSTFEEGVVSYIPSAGSIKRTIELSQTLDKIKSTLTDTGSKNIFEFHKNAVLERVSEAAISEGSSHGVSLVSEEDLLKSGLGE